MYQAVQAQTVFLFFKKIVLQEYLFLQHSHQIMIAETMSLEQLFMEVWLLTISRFLTVMANLSSTPQIQNWDGTEPLKE